MFYQKSVTSEEEILRSVKGGPEVLLSRVKTGVSRGIKSGKLSDFVWIVKGVFYAFQWFHGKGLCVYLCSLFDTSSLKL